MQIPKQQVIDFIKSKVGGDKAGQADSELPDQVDTDRDAGLLQKFGVDPKELLGGSGGGLGSKLGL
ncbi:hypothetical protein [uncultured Pseudokineococcus sp.]|uniref:hypothetical protein n=1 Tax=uncultured Pseudokineococcus sp. TaxID=1642928 RepID=UPI0026278AC8|nr:hypothetical protein [uncultured Pseudokineococcus sp.]